MLPCVGYCCRAPNFRTFNWLLPAPSNAFCILACYTANGVKERENARAVAKRRTIRAKFAPDAWIGWVTNEPIHFKERLAIVKGVSVFERTKAFLGCKPVRRRLVPRIVPHGGRWVTVGAAASVWTADPNVVAFVLRDATIGANDQF